MQLPPSWCIHVKVTVIQPLGLLLRWDGVSDLECGSTAALVQYHTRSVKISLSPVSLSPWPRAGPGGPAEPENLTSPTQISVFDDISLTLVSVHRTY